MLKDVGMTVPKIRETRAVYMQQYRGMRACNNNNMHNPKLSIYAATQGMRACNNNNMRNPPYILQFRVTHVIIKALYSSSPFRFRFGGVCDITVLELLYY